MITICGRKVKVKTGTKSQTVNICTEKNIHGEYEWIIRLRPEFFIDEYLLSSRRFNSISELISYLQKNKCGDVEISPPVYKTNKVSQTGRSIVEKQDLSEWERTAKTVVEESIDKLVSDFIRYPYLHRVEHSIHCELFKMLTANDIFARKYPMGAYFSQTVHKEWPEFLPRPEKGNRRGNFDLCIISPERLKESSFDDFRNGRIKPSIVIEIGLDYDFKHLKDDAAKLFNSGIPDSYLIHLVRQEVMDNFEAIQSYILESSIKIAYARIRGLQADYKLINDDEIKTEQIRE